MRGIVSERGRWALLVAAGVLALAALDAWWLARFRHGYPLDIDEAYNASMALNDYFALRGGGPHAWWDMVQLQAPNAPLVPALASLTFVVKAGVTESFAVLIGFMALLAAAAFGIGERLAGPRLGAMAALAVATCAGTFAFSRELIFALPAAALLSCAVYALLRSEGLRRRRWALTCGAALGLMLLARTMTVAFLPGVLLAATLVLLARAEGSRGRALANLGLLVTAAAAVAATWYWRNLESVYDYLTGFGYGDQANPYGPAHALVSWERFAGVAERIAGDLLLPLSLLVGAGLVALGVELLRRLRGPERRGEVLRALAASDAGAVAVVIACGYLALVSSRNAGNGFSFPLAVLLPPLAVLALRHRPRAVLPTAVLVGLLVALNVAASTDLSATLSRSRALAIPGLGEVPWTRGVPNAVAAIRGLAPGSDTRFDLAERGWPAADDALARYLAEDLGVPASAPIVGFGARNRVLNANTVGLATLLRFQRPLTPTQLTSVAGDTAAAYREALGSFPGGPGVLLTTSTEAGDYQPRVTQSRVEAAARSLGFRLVQTLSLPDGRQLRVWSRLPSGTG
jgi:4-amino-4-deoxy-L-arabinose transferase-like glycosyltransferase